ncbi:hypothetical protein SKAU_G00293310 [Synaphobranchus kaupii]|uniref:Phosphoinositide 3-kinase regulatory subunit 6 n=1 Tax=Synaphobranchus kaupii TaxID=118154 RepID=A0A9Q1EU96_SYNKA|nr:hypothetical protein SKAU_G00293310 [Synaphobranchus kaupii]
MACWTTWRRPSLAPTIVPTGPCPSGADSSTTAGHNIFHCIQAFLQELGCQNPPSLQQKGLLRWTLHKNVEKDPSSAAVLVTKLVKELERVQRAHDKECIIPLLLTIIYVIFQSAYIPEALFERAYAVFQSVLKLPQPYCNVGLACIRHMQTERSKPGALFQRTVLAEQSLWNEDFPFQEIVFVYADAAVFSGPLGVAVKRHLEAAGSRRSPVSHMRAVLQHTLQAALGNCCRSNALAHALKDMGRNIEPYFQEVVETMEQNPEEVGDGDADGYMARLQRLYSNILSAAGKGEPSSGSLCDTPLPTPDVRFHLWREEDELWLGLKSWIEQSLAEAPPPDMHRASQVSTDSGIERDLPENEPSEAKHWGPGNPRRGGSQLIRRHCVKKKPFRSSSLQTVSRDFTACVVLMGDDRVLGRLAKAYHSLRKGRVRVNLEMYYIPVTDQHTTTSPAKESTPLGQSYLDVASHLGRVDPWYESNIGNLAHVIPTLVETQSNSSLDTGPFLLDVLSYYKRTAWQPVHFTIYSAKIYTMNKSLKQDVFLTQLEVDFTECRTGKSIQKVEALKMKTATNICGPVVSITYRKVLLSNRQVNKGASVRTPRILISAIPSSDTEDHDQLTLSFNETQAKTSMESPIRSRNITIKAVENRTFTVCLDKDTRRTYKDVQSIEISPCLDPGCIWNTDIMNSKSSLRNLALPINTFSGIIQ